MKKVFSVKQWIVVFLMFFFAVTIKVYAFDSAGHVAYDEKYMWGLSTRVSKQIHWNEIDMIPWRDSHTAGKNHRELWGHSDEWFYNGKLPKEKVIVSIKNAHPNYSDAQINNVFCDLTAMTGQERIAHRLLEYESSLTVREAKAVAEQLHASHTLGDLHTAEGSIIQESQIIRAKQLVAHPSEAAISGYNKLVVREYIDNGGDISRFFDTSKNYETFKVAQLIKLDGVEIFNPAQRGYVGIVYEGKRYLIQKDSRQILTILNSKFPNDFVMVSNDVYNQMCRNNKFDKVIDRVVPESKITGKISNLSENEYELMKNVNKTAQKVTNERKQLVDNINQKIKNVAPHALGGAAMAIGDNWGLIRDAYSGGESWRKTINHVGTDFLGYAYSSYLTTGILTRVGNHSMIIARMNELGVGYAIGYFVYASGKEYYSYYKGDIGFEELKEQVMKNGEVAAFGVAMTPVNLVLLKFVAMAGIPGGQFIVPIVIIGGEYAYQRYVDWQKEKIWENTIYVEDIETFFRTENVSKFTFLNPREYENVIETKGRDSIFSHKIRSTLIRPKDQEILLFQ